MNLQTITIKEYLTQKGINYTERNGELITSCVFCGKEKHLYFSAETGQYDCKVCGEKGNILTLARHLGEDIKDVAVPDTTPKPKNSGKRWKFAPITAERCHQTLSNRIREYLRARGLTDDTINQYKLGFGEFYGKWWITIPIPNKDGEFEFFKLRKDPEDNANPDKYKFWPAGSKATIYGWEMLNGCDEIVLCEGEFDRLILLQNGIPAITSTAGAGTFKDEWIKSLIAINKLYVCFDRDNAGEEGAEKVIKQIKDDLPKLAIYKITLPKRMTDGKDITDYFTKYNGNAQELMCELPKLTVGFDTSKFKPLSAKELIDILGLTIKKDEENKLTTFLCHLSAYTENCQFNISFNAPSSTGKSFIPLEVSALFPEKDLIKLGNCSPTAFVHEQGEYDKEKNTMLVDLSRRILIFLDQPQNLLLEKLRSLLSHDEKEVQTKVTDKNQKGGNKTKTVILRGFPAVLFCSAGLKIDEQEGTRFLLLSPETGQEKLREAIHEKTKKASDSGAYYERLNSNPDRILLKERIKAIKAEKINDIIITCPERIEEIFLSKRAILKPRHQRDIGRLIELVKSFTLLNLWFRERRENNIVAADEDIKEAVELWEKISESQEYNIPPYVFNLYREVIVPAYIEKNQVAEIAEIMEVKSEKVGITKKELIAKHLAVYGRMLNDWYLRQQILPMLEAAGLITQESDTNGDRRKILITPSNLEI